MSRYADLLPSDTERRLAAVVRDALCSEALVTHVRELLIDHGRVSNAVELLNALPQLVGRLADTAADVVTSELVDVLTVDANYLALVRDFYLNPQSEHTLDALAKIWRKTSDDLHTIFHDQLYDWVHSHPGDESAFRVEWKDAITTSTHLNLIRPFHVQLALGADFPRAQTSFWLTVPILTRLRILSWIRSSAIGRSSRRRPFIRHVYWEHFVFTFFGAEFPKIHEVACKAHRSRKPPRKPRTAEGKSRA